MVTNCRIGCRQQVLLQQGRPKGHANYETELLEKYKLHLVRN